MEASVDETNYDNEENNKTDGDDDNELDDHSDEDDSTDEKPETSRKVLWFEVTEPRSLFYRIREKDIKLLCSLFL